MSKTLIVSGGNISKRITKKLISEGNFTHIIAVDKGLEVLDELEILPNHIIGDFDSVNKKVLGKYLYDERVECHKLEEEKDFTDTHMAVNLAITLNSKEIIIIGATGVRLDHVIANIHVMKEAVEKNIICKIIDESNEIMLINKETNIIKNKEYGYISLLPLTNTVKGVTLKGFKYKLQNSTLNIGKSIGISNEQIEDISTIEVKEGILIIIKSKD